METESADPSDGIDNREICEPCKEQGHKRTALYWCSDCPELLCNNCYDHHKVQKATKNHKSLGIDEYRNIGANIADLDSNCKYHCENEIEFICLTHSRPCCLICKSELHGSECDVKTKDEILQGNYLPAKLNNTIETINRLIDDVEKSAPIQGQSTSQLEEQRNLFYEELRSGREKVNQLLDTFEESVKINFENILTSSHQKILEHIKILEDKKLNLIKRREIVQKVKKFPGLKLYLIHDKFHRDNANDQTQIKSICEEAQNISCISKPVFEVNEESKFITLNDVIDSKSENKIPKQIKCKSDGFDFSSSTVEAELELGITSLTVEAEDEIVIPLSTLDSVETPNTPSSTSGAGEKPDILSTTVEAGEERDIPQSILGAQGDIGLLSSNRHDEHSYDRNFQTDSYELTKRFFIERRNKDIYIRCARFLEEDKIVMTETSDERVLVYKTNGQKIGQVMIDDKPGDIAVLGNDIVVVAAQKTLVFIDTDLMEIDMERDFCDYIFSIGYANDEIFLCLEHKGMNVLDTSGNILRYIPFIRGELYICLTFDSTIFSAKFHSNKIFSFRENSNIRQQYNYDEPLCVYGMTCDNDDNIYFATKSNGIVKLDPSTETFSTILAAADGQTIPFSVDYNKGFGELLIIDSGREVFVFSK